MHVSRFLDYLGRLFYRPQPHQRELDRFELLIKQGEVMTAELKAQFDRAKADAAELKTVIASALALIASIPDLIRQAVSEASNDTDAVAAAKELADTIEQDSADIKAKLLANTPPAGGAVVLSITGFNPASAVAGSPDFTLTVNGTGFVTGAVVKADGEALDTSFNNAMQLTAAVPASSVTAPKSIVVTVVNPDGTTSVPVSFSVNS